MSQRQPSLEDFALLAEVSEMLTVLDQQRVLDRIIEASARAVGAEQSSLLLNLGDNEDWRQIFIGYFPDPQGGGGHAPTVQLAGDAVSAGLPGWVIQAKKAAIVTDTHTDARWQPIPGTNPQARSALAVPFIYSGEVLAVLTLVHSQPKYFEEYHQQLLTIVANQATVAVRNAQLFNRMLEQQQQLQAMLLAMPDLLLVLDESGTIMLLNDPAEQFLNSGGEGGRGGGTLLGRPLSDFAAADSTIAEVLAWLRAGLAGDTLDFEVRSAERRRDFLGTVSLWASPISGKHGYVIVMRDVTQLRDLDRFKNEVLHLASHDLRSPLALIVGYCNLIELDTPEDSPVRAHLQVILRTTHRMDNLLNALVRVEKIRKSPLELHQSIDFHALVKTAVANQLPTYQSRRQTITTELQLDDAPLISLDPVLIGESMENLLSNASKYSAEGERVIVRADYADGRFHYMVEDHGIGIPEDELPALFQSFYRTRSVREESIPGQGLGLSLVKTIVERHGGDVWVESEEGKGSRFGFWLPSNPTESSAP
ncbi:MAG: GAF domain-containing protein [Chloroflexi bacterium]|nr:GAF domain-containing protein [Chloroflexota bacterium]